VSCVRKQYHLQSHRREILDATSPLSLSPSYHANQISFLTGGTKVKSRTAMQNQYLHNAVPEPYIYQTRDRAVAQAVSLWLPTRWPGFSSGQSMWGVWWTKWHWGRFSPSTSISPANHHSTNFSIIIITRDWHNRPIGGLSANSLTNQIINIYIQEQSINWGRRSCW
jgi:hypothetical protein